MAEDVTIVGAGIVGLATAYQMLKTRKLARVIVLEKEPSIAAHQTGNNSGVIHSGIYYKPGSLKAENCIEGYHLLLEFCRQKKIPFEICGKLIVATNESQLPLLQSIYERGVANGLTGLRLVSESEIREREPSAAGIRGLIVPQTGIVDFRRVAVELLNEIQAMGGEVRFNTRVKGITTGPRVSIHTDQALVTTDHLITAAGLYSDQLAKFTHPDIDFQIIPFRGEYYALKSERAGLIRHLIYPVPDPDFPFLGVHFTRRIDGTIEAGPNAVLAFAREGYRKSTINFVELSQTLRFIGFRRLARRYWRTGLAEIYRSISKRAFTNALRRLVPEVGAHDLVRAGAGVRAQACLADGVLVDDFLILRRKNITHVCNAPSPAATSSLAIGLRIARSFQEVP